MGIVAGDWSPENPPGIGHHLPGNNVISSRVIKIFIRGENGMHRICFFHPRDKEMADTKGETD